MLERVPRAWTRPLLAACLLVATPPIVAAQPFTPQSDDDVMETLAASTVAARALRARAGNANAGRRDLAQSVAIAREHIRLARAEGDPRHHGYAQAALAEWWSLDEPPSEVLVLRAVVRQARHEFSRALEDLQRAIARDPGNAQAWLTRATILRVQGELARARESCEPLFQLVAPLIAKACLSAAAAQHGQARVAYGVLARELAYVDDSEPTIRQWAHTVLAELAVAIGDTDLGEVHFKAGLELAPSNAYLLGAYADFLLDSGRAREARALLLGTAQSDGVLLRLALAERRLAHPALSDRVSELARRFKASQRRGGSAHLRDAARAALWLFDDPKRALALAVESWREQREPWDTRLVLEAALAMRQPHDAQPVLDWLRTQSLDHVRIASLARRVTELQDASTH